MIYTDIFNTANIFPSEISYSAVALTADIVLNWPEETSTSDNLATRIMDVTPSGSYSITLPDASKTGTGNTILFTNKGATSFIVKNAAGTQVVSLSAGTAWQVYLSDNSTEAGVWQALQFGATVSSANASSLAGTGIVAVGTLLSQSVPITNITSSYSAGSSDRAKMLNWVGDSSGTFTLPHASTVGVNWFVYFRNSSSNSILVTPSGSDTLDSETSIYFQPNDSAIIASDGSDFYTIGRGQSSVFAFDYVVVDVTGSGDFTLTGGLLNRISYKFTGTPTAARNIIVPQTVQQYWVDNEVTNSYDLTLKTTVSGAVSTAVSKGSRAILYCDSANVLSASTAGISLPLTVSQGGTGTSTPGSGALTNIGATSLGVALATALSEAEVWSILGAAQAGTINGGTF